MTRARWLERGDVRFDCSHHRLLYEFVVRRRGTNAVGKYGMGVARRWLESLGAELDLHRVMHDQLGRPILPDLVDKVSGITYEVKTGQKGLDKSAITQIARYNYAVESRKTTMVVYINVAFQGRVGLTIPYRRALAKSGFKLLFLL